MSVNHQELENSRRHQELEAFNHQEARFAFHHESFMDSLSVGRTRTQVVVALVGVLILTLCCVLACLVYLAILIEHHNYHAATWAFLTAAVSAGMSTLFILHVRTKLEEWHDRKTLESIKLFGMIMSVISGTALGIYLITGFMENSDFLLDGTNYFSAALFCSLCLGVSLFLYFVAQWYQNAIQFVEAARSIDLQNIIHPALEVSA